MQKENQKMEFDYPSEEEQALLDARISTVVKHIVPIFKYDDEGIPFVNGTGFLFAYQEKKFIATAHHVLKKRDEIRRDKDGLIFFQFESGMNRLDLLIPDFVPDQDFMKQIDVTTIALMDSHVKAFGEDRFYQIKGYLDDTGTEGNHACAMGYPETGNRYNSFNRIFPNKTSVYVGALKSDEEIQKMGYRSKLNFGLNFDIKRSMSNGQKKIKAREPYGISGGPIWLIRSSSSQIVDGIAPIFLGIATTYLPSGNMLIGTHGNVLLMQIDKSKGLPDHRKYHDQ